MGKLWGDYKSVSHLHSYILGRTSTLFFFPIAINSTEVFLTLLFIYIFTSFFKIEILLSLPLSYMAIMCSSRRQKRDCRAKGLGFLTILKAKKQNKTNKKKPRRHGSCYFYIILMSIPFIIFKHPTILYWTFILISWILVTHKFLVLLLTVIYWYSNGTCFQTSVSIHIWKRTFHSYCSQI